VECLGSHHVDGRVAGGRKYRYVREVSNIILWYRAHHTGKFYLRRMIPLPPPRPASTSRRGQEGGAAGRASPSGGPARRRRTPHHGQPRHRASRWPGGPYPHHPAGARVLPYHPGRHVVRGLTNIGPPLRRAPRPARPGGDRRRRRRRRRRRSDTDGGNDK
jgi:hypothetical protein